MLEKIKEAFAHLVFLTPKDLLDLAIIAKIKTVKKGGLVVRVGDFNHNGMMVLKGLLAHYVMDLDGQEKTLLFVSEKMTSGAMQTIFNEQPADENIIALEDSILLTMDTRAINKLAEGNIRIMRMLNQEYRRLIVMAAERIKFLTVMSPEERYEHFCKKHPNLEQRIKQKHLASFLGITPTSLSRMRARMAKS